ncbi:TetR/AcrR family transcriptional regulator [Spirosoma sp. 209]|uniref:TetR/AcrR family transcriptional regulator n=1 Tax=Spirosoma sp. 209 TaxID=1955701 RepID=UPI00098D439B|nr:TetR/AcrR family transcriptional regulator [Spirosoma sp. 209]
MKEIQKSWIEKGYRMFAYGGPQELKVERLAAAVGKNKSSFYHHFADLEVFTSILLDYHMEQVGQIARKESQCTSLDELIDIIVTHKLDLLVNRQLRIHRTNKEFEACFVKTNQLTVPAIMGIWSAILGLTDQSHLAGLVLTLSLDNFYLQITEETLNHGWLTQYFSDLQGLVRAFSKTGTASPAVLDGSV